MLGIFCLVAHMVRLYALESKLGIICFCSKNYFLSICSYSIGVTFYFLAILYTKAL